MVGQVWHVWWLRSLAATTVAATSSSYRSYPTKSVRQKCAFKKILTNS
jgi:hypothetical protein